jgi:hypothetical protein
MYDPFAIFQNTPECSLTLSECWNINKTIYLFIYLFIYWLTILDIQFCFKKGKGEKKEEKKRKKREKWFEKHNFII